MAEAFSKSGCGFFLNVDEAFFECAHDVVESRRAFCECGDGVFEFVCSTQDGQFKNASASTSDTATVTGTATVFLCACLEDVPEFRVRVFLGWAM